jgi:hypothetical protein
MRTGAKHQVPVRLTDRGTLEADFPFEMFAGMRAGQSIVLEPQAGSSTHWLGFLSATPSPDERRDAA